jgi:hypothetical protein
MKISQALEAVESEIAKLQKVANALRSIATEKRTRTGKISLDGRKRIAEAQRLRWAKLRAKTKH